MFNCNFKLGEKNGSKQQIRLLSGFKSWISDLVGYDAGNSNNQCDMGLMRRFAAVELGGGGGGG